MIKKITSPLIFLLFSWTLILNAETINHIPCKFFVKQHWLSFTNTFDIESKDRKFGTIHRKLFSLMPQYLFYDLDDQVQAKAKMRFFSLGATFDIYDAWDVPLGKVDERLLTFFSTFDLYRADGYPIAKAKLNFWGTKYTISDPQTNEVIAFLWRNFFRLKDDWTVDIINPSLLVEKKIDLRMFILVMAFQTDRDYWESTRKCGHKKGLKASLLNAEDSSEYLAAQFKLEKLRESLHIYEEQLKGIEPSEEDIKSLDKMTEDLLAHFESECHELDQMSSELIKMQLCIKGFDLFIPLLESEDLTQGQKSALLYFMDQKLY